MIATYIAFVPERLGAIFERLHLAQNGANSSLPAHIQYALKSDPQRKANTNVHKPIT